MAVDKLIELKCQVAAETQVQTHTAELTWHNSFAAVAALTTTSTGKMMTKLSLLKGFALFVLFLIILLSVTQKLNKKLKLFPFCLTLLPFKFFYY